MEKWKANIISDALSLIEFGQWLSAYSRNLISGLLLWFLANGTSRGLIAKTQNTFNGHLM